MPEKIMQRRSPLNTKQQRPNQQENEIGGGGKFVKMEDESFDLILNVLIGIKRSLSALSDVIPQQLDTY